MFAAIAIVCALVFVRLGLWQVDRLGDRRAENEVRRARLAEPVLELSGIPPDGSDGAGTDPLPWRRVRLEGEYDYRQEVVLRGRSLRGRPGVHVVTPLRLAGGRAVLVLRGWLPAADGVSARLAEAQPAGGESEGRVIVEGLALGFEEASSLPPRRHRFDRGERRVLASLSAAQVRQGIPYPIADVFVLAAGDGKEPASVPVPELSDGPHLLYAVQWFAFAVISLVGAALYVRAGTRSPGPVPTSRRDSQPEVEDGLP